MERRQPRRILPFPRGYEAYTGNQSQDRTLTVANDRYLQNVAYLRLKKHNRRLYTLPCLKKYLEQIRIYFGRELAYWSPMKKHNKYIDPEAAVSGSSYKDNSAKCTTSARYSPSASTSLSNTISNSISTMNLYKYLTIIGVGLAAASCDLDEMPQDSISPDSFFRTEADLEQYTNQFYLMEPDAASLYDEPSNSSSTAWHSRPYW